MVKFEYGLSLASSENCAMPLLSRGSALAYFELSGQTLEKKLSKRQLRSVINLMDVIPSSTASGIVDQDRKIVQDFRLRLSELITRMNSQGIFSFTMDNGIEGVPGNPAHAEKLISFIKSLVPMLYEKKTFMNLPLRVPEISKGSAEKYLKFKTDLMSPYIRFAVNIYPHDLKRDYSPEDLLRFFRFDLGIVRIMYEPEIGNRLVEKHVEPWVEYLKKNHFNGPLLFCPRISNEESLTDEIAFLTEFLATM